MGRRIKDRVAQFGGNANNGTQAGTFYWNVNNSSSNDNRNIGSRFAHCFAGLSVKEVRVPHPLVKQKSHKSLVGIPKSLAKMGQFCHA